MRRGIGRTEKIALAAVMLVLVLGGGSVALYYASAPRTTEVQTSSSLGTLNATSSSTVTTVSTAPVDSYKVIEVLPHDTGAFTEGLVYHNGSLYESTGIYGNSSLRRVDIATGKVLQIYNMSSQYFGEGIAIVNDTVIQLTYQSQIGFVYKLATLGVIENFSYPDEGWGLTYDGSQLIASDGSSNLYFLNPETFQRTGGIAVHDGTTPILNLNSLDYINGSIFANVWLTNRIAVINPGSGLVTAWIDLTGIENLTGCRCDLSNDVLNGIAYDSQNNRLFVTGKDWPNLFEIQIVPPLPHLAQSHRLSGPSIPSGHGDGQPQVDVLRVLDGRPATHLLPTSSRSTRLAR
jgi:glutaminyl-peptide cyclotransferase